MMNRLREDFASAISKTKPVAGVEVTSGEDTQSFVVFLRAMINNTRTVKFGAMPIAKPGSPVFDSRPYTVRVFTKVALGMFQAGRYFGGDFPSWGMLSGGPVEDLFKEKVQHGPLSMKDLAEQGAKLYEEWGHDQGIDFKPPVGKNYFKVRNLTIYYRPMLEVTVVNAQERKIVGFYTPPLKDQLVWSHRDTMALLQSIYRVGEWRTETPVFGREESKKTGEPRLTYMTPLQVPEGVVDPAAVEKELFSGDYHFRE